jgi:TRAP-type C4-dicarboxylate transport system permease small subunit
MPSRDKSGVEQEDGRLTDLLGGTTHEALTKLGPIELVCQRVCEVALWVLVALVIVGIVARDFLHLSFSMSDEVGGYILVGLTFVSMPVCQRSGAFHKVMFFQARLSPKPRAMLNLAFDIICFTCCALLVWKLTVQVLESWQSDAVAPTPLATPLWIPQFFMPLGCLLLAIVLLHDGWRNLRNFLDWGGH